MSPHNWAARFAIRLAILYAVLIIPWPGARTGFRAAYRATATAVSRLVGLGDYLAMGDPVVLTPQGDVAWIATNPKLGRLLRIEHGSRDWAFLPIAAALAMVLAVPSPWPKRWKATVVLMSGIALFLVLRLAVAGAYGLAALKVFAMSPKSLDAFGKLMVAICATPIASYVVPVIFWLIVMYRYHDLSFLIARPETAGQQESEPRA